jgi:hypothetical protein
METLYESTSNKKVDNLLTEISMLSREEKEFLRIQLQAAYWLKEDLPLLQLVAEDGEMSLCEINEIKHLSRSENA